VWALDLQRTPVYTAAVPTPQANPKIDAYIAKAAPFAQPILLHLPAHP